jgi:hypothetical protein
MKDPPPKAVIAGTAWCQNVTMLVGESGASKTFVLLDMAATVSDGRRWHDRGVRQGAVAYISFEGDALGLRLRALQEAGSKLEHVYVLQAREPLSPRVERDGTERPSLGEQALAEELQGLTTRLIETGGPGVVLIVIDTVRASMTGSEDRSEDAAAYLRAVRRLLAPYPEAACILVHHAGWQDGETKRKRERGSSALRGNVDATLYVEVTEENPELGLAYLSLTALKVRDDLRPPPLRLIRSRVTLQTVDEDGRSRRTCRIEADGRSREDLDAAVERTRAEANAALDQAALDMIGKHAITSVATFRTLLGVSKATAESTLARLLLSGRVRPPVKQRAPYAVVSAESDRVGPSGTDQDRVRPASSRTDSPPIGGSPTRARRGPRPKAESDRRRPPRRPGRGPDEVPTP